MQRTSRQAVAAALVLVGAAIVAPSAHSADGPPAPASSDDQLETVTVTGSLIPMGKDVVVPTPVITITAADLSNQGFTSIAQALQNQTVATGSVQGAAFAGFTQGAQTLSMFGLDPSFTKYLIDGKPMGDYPALYNGSENFNSISGIPIELVDRIDVLPGGQSSLYGSDAVAGVVNIILKKSLDAPIADIRYGWDQLGGGSDRRFALADSVSFGGLTVLGGVQYELTAPVWGYQRAINSETYPSGSSPQTAFRDYLLYGELAGAYIFEDPTNCANVASQNNGTTTLRTRANLGQYCGSNEGGQYTINNGDSGLQGYIHTTFDLNDHVEFYFDTLINHDVTSTSSGPYAYNNTFYGNDPSYEFYDLNIGDYMEMQHLFSPEEAGGLGTTMSEDITNAIRFSTGAKGTILASAWNYDASFTYDQQKLQERSHQLNAPLIEAYFNSLLGPSMDNAPGADPLGIGVNSYAPDYSAFYQPLTSKEYNSFVYYATSHSYTEDSLARGQLTNSALFHLPGGNAGVAFVVEGGREGWQYDPDPSYENGVSFGYTSVGGSGERSRYAGTLEMRLPVLDILSLSGSARYDKYIVTGGDFDKFTYNVGFDFHPIPLVSVRGRYGTAFKAPTLADEFQGPSGYFSSSGVIDYYNCTKLGYTGANVANCPPAYQFADPEGITSGNTALKPMTANVFDAGIVLTPFSNLTISGDYLHWAISNEVETQSQQTVVQLDSECLLGELDATSPTCVQAEAQVVRGGADDSLISVATPKVNVANEDVNALLAQVNWVIPAGKAGQFTLSGSWTDMLKHSFQQYPGDSYLNYLDDPFYSQEFKSKINASLTWDIGKLSSTVYVARYGRTPNYIAETYGGDEPGAGTLAQYTITNATVRYQVTKQLLVQLIGDNIFGTMPPVDHSYLGTTDQPYNELNYNVYGRQYAVEATYKFIR